MGKITSEQIAIPHPPSARGEARIKLYEELEGGQGREIFFRPQRYTPEQFAPLNLWVELNLDGVHYRCELRDLSQGGLGVVWPLPNLPSMGEPIDEITVCFDHQYAYVGKAVVSVMREEEGNLIGLDLRDSLIKVDALLQTRDLKRFHLKGDAPFGGRFQAWQAEGHHEFKGRVGELKLFLEDWETHFDRVEAQASWDLLRFEEDHPTRKALTELVHRDFMAPFLEQTERVFESLHGLSKTEQEPLKAYSQRYLDAYLMKAPWMHRARTKPLGYPGDYEVMNHIYGRRMQGRTLIGQAINYATLHSPAARAVRNRKDMLKFELKRTVERLSAQGDLETPIKILSVAAGPAQETYELLSEMKMITRPIDIVLFDQDAAALAFAYGRLKRLVDDRWPEQVRLVYLHDSIRRLLEDADIFKGFGPFDAIICSGLYDYLRHSTAVKLSSHMHGYAKPGGAVYIGNMVPSNPSRWIMEHHLDWELLYRDHEEILGFAQEATPNARHELLTEPSGVNPFVRITRLD